MNVIEFRLPDHPVRGEQNIVLEKPRKNSVWYLGISEDKSIPLPRLDREPSDINKVLDEIREQQGEDWLREFVTDGYSIADIQDKKKKKLNEEMV